MTTPVVTRKVQSVGEKMEMTTPVITSKVLLYLNNGSWSVSFWKLLAYFNVDSILWSSFE